VEETELDPDERAFRAHIADARFLAGVADGRWTVIEDAWPLVTFAIAAAPRENSPKKYFLRANLSGYPFAAPTSAPWDAANNQPLASDKRPKGERVGHVFRTDWESGSALYAPYDRVALGGHGNWAVEHPRYVWTPERDVTWFLGVISDLLMDDDYLGI
jgi:hypothetical protein